ncbi:MAG: hypothetical protein ASARMPREDX12_004446 [Alectoria sarmentosa]|nr:MAG: hypothetical protein ASARMPREDX12_004446 [Alectoria sarmentosa]
MDAAVNNFTDAPPTLQGSMSGTADAGQDVCQDDHDNISILAMSKQAGQTVAPFLAKHIPEQYAPGGGLDSSGNSKMKDPNTKYCYRHQPDLKCRRQANEPSMDQLQHELEDLSQGDQQAIAHVWSLFSAAPAKHRNLMLQGILTQCCFPQLSYLSTNVRDLIRIDFLTALPPEISYKVLCFLDTTSLCKAAQVSQRWRSLADDDVVWHRMCEQHIDRKCTKCGWGLPLLERKRLRASKRQIQLRATGRGLNEWSPDITPYPEAALEAVPNNDAKDQMLTTAKLTAPLPKNQTPSLATPMATDSYFRPRTRPWKDVYKDRFRVGINWKHGRCDLKIFRGHQNGVMCLQFDDSVLITGSYDAMIKVWDLASGEEIQTLKGHTSGIRCLQFDDSKLISGSIDRTLKIWDWRKGECIATHDAHSNGIVGLHFDSSLLATASMDKTIKIWNFTDSSRFTLRGHTDWVNAVRVDSASRTVLSASDDCTVKLWDLDTKSCIKTFEGHVGQVQQVITLPHDFDFEDTEVDDSDGTSSTTSTQSHPQFPQPATQAEPYGPGFTASDRPMPPRFMLTGALDGTIRLWDTYTSKCLRTYFGHVEGVWALAADSLRVVSGAEDRMVKVWDTRSGKCERTFTGHAGPVSCLGLSDNRMCTGGEDNEVRMYSF